MYTQMLQHDNREAADQTAAYLLGECLEVGGRKQHPVGQRDFSASHQSDANHGQNSTTGAATHRTLD